MADKGRNTDTRGKPKHASSTAKSRAKKRDKNAVKQIVAASRADKNSPEFMTAKASVATNTGSKFMNKKDMKELKAEAKKRKKRKK